MIFECTNKNKSKKEKWTGKIEYIEDYGSHYEISIQSRSSIIVLLGETSQGNFACIPDWKAGCHLGSLNDKFYNTEKLCTAMNNEIDGITVASALSAVADLIESK